MNPTDEEIKRSLKLSRLIREEGWDILTATHTLSRAIICMAFSHGITLKEFNNLLDRMRMDYQELKQRLGEEE